MGTNYYLKSDVCSICGRSAESKHIGKSSLGWVFMLHVYPENGIYDLPNWKDLWSKKGSVIVDEYECPISPNEMSAIIEKRRTDRSFKNSELPKHYKSWSHFHDINRSQEGPNGLYRMKISSFCISHGEGTWDLCVGEYS